jgi:hypothetical protein
MRSNEYSTREDIKRGYPKIHDCGKRSHGGFARMEGKYWGSVPKLYNMDVTPDKKWGRAPSFPNISPAPSMCEGWPRS